MSVDIGSFTARPTIFRKLSHFKSWWHEKSLVCWTWTNRNLLKYSGVPIGTCHQMVGKGSHVCLWCHHASRALGKGGMRLQLRSDPLLWSHVVKDEVSCLIFRMIISLVREYLQTSTIHGLFSKVSCSQGNLGGNSVCQFWHRDWYDQQCLQRLAGLTKWHNHHDYAHIGFGVSHCHCLSPKRVKHK